MNAAVAFESSLAGCGGVSALLEIRARGVDAAQAKHNRQKRHIAPDRSPNLQGNLPRAQVAVARGAVAEGDFVGASVTLDDVESSVASLRATEDISDDHADEIDAALDGVRSALASYVAGTATTTLPPPSSASADDGGPNEERDNGDDKGPDNGRDKGKQRDGGRDDKD